MIFEGYPQSPVKLNEKFQELQKSSEVAKMPSGLFIPSNDPSLPHTIFISPDLSFLDSVLFLVHELAHLITFSSPEALRSLALPVETNELLLPTDNADFIQALHMVGSEDQVIPYMKMLAEEIIHLMFKTEVTLNYNLVFSFPQTAANSDLPNEAYSAEVRNNEVIAYFLQICATQIIENTLNVIYGPQHWGCLFAIFNFLRRKKGRADFVEIEFPFRSINHSRALNLAMRLFRHNCIPNPSSEILEDVILTEF